MTLDQLPKGSSVGTSSLRRTCQLLARRPDLKIVSVRGNVQTRLRKVDELGLSGAVLALAGLRRLGLEEQVVEILEPEVSLPAAGQGALAIQCREDDAELRALLGALDDSQTRDQVTAERAFLARLEGGCTVPLAAYAVPQRGELWLRGLVGSPDGKKMVRGERRGLPSAAAALGEGLAEELLERGAGEILAAFAGKAGGGIPGGAP
jgi:hydroxymethylbilane synthase